MFRSEEEFVLPSISLLAGTKVKNYHRIKQEVFGMFYDILFLAGDEIVLL